MDIGGSAFVERQWAGRIVGTMNSAEILIQFVNAINNHDLTALISLMTADHVFVDSLGNEIHGATSMEAGWRGYFAMSPDYAIHTDHVIAEGEVALAVGTAGGSIDGITWQTPAAWKAVVRDHKVAEWQVFADNKPVYEILAKRER